MKWILLLLLSFNLQAQTSGTPSDPLISCDLESHEGIDACTIEDKLPHLLTRLYPALRSIPYAQYHMEDPCDPLTVDIEETEEIEVCPLWDQKTNNYTYQEQTYDVGGMPELSLFDRLDMLSKPLIAVFDQDLLDWKVSMKDELDFKLSIQNLDRFRRRMVKCGYNQPNMALLKKDILKQKDILKRDCLSSHSDSLDSEDSITALKIEVVKDLEFSKSLTVDFLMHARISDIGLSKNAKRLKAKRLHLKLKDVKDLLGSGSIESAKAELEIVSVDSDFSQGTKDSFLLKINSHLGQ